MRMNIILNLIQFHVPSLWVVPLSPSSLLLVSSVQKCLFEFQMFVSLNLNDLTMNSSSPICYDFHN